MATTYNYSDGSTTITGTSTTSDELIFTDDAGGTFSHINFYFTRSGDDLIIHSDNGETVTIEDQFLNDTTRYETLSFTGGASIDLSASNLLVGSDAWQNETNQADLILGDSKSSTTINALDGDDVIYGGDMYRVLGKDGDDIIYGGTGKDILNGNDGNDTLYGEEGNDNLQGDGGDMLYGGDGNDRIQGGEGNDIIYGDDGDDEIYGGPGDDIIYGGDGNDTIQSHANGPGSDNDQTTEFIDAGAGDDTIAVNRHSFAEIEGGAGDDYYELRFSGAYDTDATIYDESGADDYLRIRGRSTDFTFNVSGNDLVITQIGNNYTDTITITDHLVAGHQIETIEFNDGLISPPIETLTINDDTYTASSSTSPIGSNDNIIDALAGNDTIDGGIGNDTILGRDGNDTLIGGAGDDILDGGNGNADIADYSTDTAGVIVNLNQGTATDGYGDTDTLIEIEDIIGSAYNDILTGSNMSSSEIHGGDGDDAINGMSGAGYLYGDAGNDTIAGGGSTDLIYGGTGNDTLNGGNANDTLYGDDGNDVLYGNANADILWGGDDADTFGFLTADTLTYQNHDTIKDFSLSEGDMLDISDILSGGYDAGTNDITDFVLFTDNGLDTDLSIDADGTVNGVSWLHIATIENITGQDEVTWETNGTFII